MGLIIVGESRMPIVECKNERCVFHRRKVTHRGFVDRCAKRRVHISAGGIKGICLDFTPKSKRVIQTLERLKRKKGKKKIDVVEFMDEMERR